MISGGLTTAREMQRSRSADISERPGSTGAWGNSQCGRIEAPGEGLKDCIERWLFLLSFSYPFPPLPRAASSGLTN